ncbi:hypothetical protein HPB51_019737 [Rhipicephalus microplus]|uniref:Uncharacterized protein n=1 Tax=Rhipicephalus microplus TaxID=6941 RepID=A0A9J6F623_RHIMP|nr:hypothetical protein HPB51_019737 [Rhipicephalus microplus]
MTTLQDTVVPETDEPCKAELPVVHEVNNVAEMHGGVGGVRADKFPTSGVGGKPSPTTFANMPSEDPRDKKCRVAQLKSRIAVFREIYGRCQLVEKFPTTYLVYMASVIRSGSAFKQKAKQYTRAQEVRHYAGLQQSASVEMRPPQPGFDAATFGAAAEHRNHRDSVAQEKATNAAYGVTVGRTSLRFVDVSRETEDHSLGKKERIDLSAAMIASTCRRKKKGSWRYTRVRLRLMCGRGRRGHYRCDTDPQRARDYSRIPSSVYPSKGTAAGSCFPLIDLGCHR